MTIHDAETLHQTNAPAITLMPPRRAAHSDGAPDFVNQIAQGDCVEALKASPNASVDFTLTDPPYLVRYVSRDGRGVPNDDNDAWLKPAFREIYRVLKPGSFCVSFYGWHQTDRFMGAWREAGFGISGHFVFPKRYASASRFTRYQHEQAYLLVKGRPALPPQPIPDVLPWEYTHNRLHPTQKPVSILKTLINAFSAPGAVVLDPFCGSGSTLVAAHSTGRNYFGIELDTRYHEIAVQRLRRAAIECAA